MNLFVGMAGALALTVHAGALLCFALLLAFRRRIPHVHDHDLVRVYRSFGAGIGLSLGVLVPCEIYRHCTTLNPGVGLPSALALHFDTPENTAWSARVITLFALWVSYIVLEVWTNEHTRRLDQNGVVADTVAYASATSAVSRHLSVNAALAAGVVLFGAWAQSA